MKLMASTKRRTQAGPRRRCCSRRCATPTATDRLAANAIELLDALHGRTRRRRRCSPTSRRGTRWRRARWRCTLAAARRRRREGGVPSIEIVGPKGRTAEESRRASAGADDVLHVSRSRCQEIVGKLAAHEEAFQKAFKASRSSAPTPSTRRRSATSSRRWATLLRRPLRAGGRRLLRLHGRRPGRHARAEGAQRPHPPRRTRQRPAPSALVEASVELAAAWGRRRQGGGVEEPAAQGVGGGRRTKA